ncbi:MAG TPA: nitrilase-related carbon-nitrogen hydrolase [Planctomycetota bacterium]|nr:nitrilase-related carbon-nitrogen hydrolase [Planctomycetota bacterium]
MILAAFQFAPAPGDAARNAAAVERGLRAAAAKGARLVALPELWPTSFAYGDLKAALASTQRALESARAVSRELGLVVVGSALADSGRARPLNLGHVIDRGDVLARYAKAHLFTPTHEDKGFEAGEALPPVVETSAGLVSIAICYDLRFPELCRAAFLGGAEIVVVPAQWAAERFEQWRALVIGRAVENQCVFVGANRTGSETTPGGAEATFPGRSLIADGHGEVLAEGGDGEELVAADVDLARLAALRRLIPCRKDRRPDVYGNGR